MIIVLLLRSHIWYDLNVVEANNWFRNQQLAIIEERFDRHVATKMKTKTQSKIDLTVQIQWRLLQSS